MKKITINKKDYEAREFDFNLMCDLEDAGITMDDMTGKTMSFVRAYISFCIGNGKEYAGLEIQKHIISGGSLDDVMSVMREMMDESDFFRALAEKTE